MTRREFLAAAPAAAFAQTRRAARPNIVLILADDLGYGDLGCYGQKQILTPNLDRLAAEGTRFTQAYAGSTVCAPSRCSLMTGLHTGHCRTRGNHDPDLPLRAADLTVAELLAKAGYRNGLFGKWPLGGLGTSGYPLRKGFEEWFGFFSQTHAHNYYPEHLLHNQREYLLKGNTGTRRTEYAHDVIQRFAMEFLRRHDPRPFFLHLSYTIPHANNEMGRDTGNGMEVPDDRPYSGRDWPQPERNMAAMVTRLDRSVGQVMEELKLSGRDGETLVIFTSDNGPHHEGGHDPAFFGSGGGLRGIKRDLYEGGIRVPFLARWPQKVPSGRVSEQAMAFWDFLPTCAELAGAPAPGGLDGISMLPAFLGRRQKNHQYLYWEFHERGFQQAARMDRWKAVKPRRGMPLELYDLHSDPSERYDVREAHPDIAARLEQILRSARTESPDWPVKD